MEFLNWMRNQWDRAAAVVLIAAGLVALLAGWLGLSRSELPAEQLPYAVSGGVAAMVLVVVGATLWLSADLRDEWRKLDSLEHALGAQDTTAEQPAGPRVVTRVSREGVGGERVLDNGRRVGHGVG